MLVIQKNKHRAFEALSRGDNGYSLRPWASQVSASVIHNLLSQCFLSVLVPLVLKRTLIHYQLASIRIPFCTEF